MKTEWLEYYPGLNSMMETLEGGIVPSVKYRINACTNCSNVAWAGAACKIVSLYSLSYVSRY